MAESLAHKFGQIIGEVLELAIYPHLNKFAKDNKLFVDRKGKRNTRKGIKVTWTDFNGNKHDLDFVLEKAVMKIRSELLLHLLNPLGVEGSGIQRTRYKK